MALVQREPLAIALAGQPDSARSDIVAGVRREDDVLRAMKAAHVKTQADEAMRSGNYGSAVDKYTQCIALSPGGERDTKLLCNRSLALLKAGRHALSAEDADRACKLSPEWNKAWFRRGAAHAALGDHAAALASYSCGLRLDPDNREVRAAVRATVRRLTREQLAAELLQRLAALQASGALLPPEKEDVSDAERSEAMFRHLYMWMRDKPAPGDYYDYVTLWSEAPWTAGMAYLHRAAMYVRAKCYAQAGCDAAAAAALFESSSSVAAARLPGQPDPNRLVVTHIHKPGTTEPFLRARLDPLAWAWFLRGEAHAAEDGHPAQDWGAAAGCFVRAVDLDPVHPDYALRLADAAGELNNAQLSGVLDAVYVARGGAGGQAAAALGLADVPTGDAHRCVVTLRFPKARAADFTAAARDAFRAAAADAARVTKKKVLIERVRPPAAVARDVGATPALEVRFQIHFGAAAQLCTQFAARCRSEPACVLGAADAAVHALLGVPDTNTASAVCEDVTYRGDASAASGMATAGEAVIARAMRAHNEQRVVPARPLKDMELPYKSYRLSRADGRCVERVDKHPFQLSRVFYASRERPEEVWAEMLDGSCRWRQSASEVSIIAMRVPASMRKADLDVCVDLHTIRVASRVDGCVYLEGELERGIVPDESVWAHGGGSGGSDGENGFVFYLKKMNLELLVSDGAHAETWWPRLFRHHPEIAWDDYEKDYSDLPEPVMRTHLEIEAREACSRRLEGAEKRELESADERDDVRRRTRQERLHVLRGGAPLSWVDLDRLNPAVDDMPAMPASREGALLDVVRQGAAARRAGVLAGALGVQGTNAT